MYVKTPYPFPSLPFSPSVPWVPCDPVAPWTPVSPFCPLSPVVTKETTISSVSVNGFADEDVSIEISVYQNPVWSATSEIAYSKNSELSALLATLICPLTADVTASIDVINESIELPKSSVESITALLVNAWLVEPVKFKTPWPGSVIVVFVLNV